MRFFKVLLFVAFFFLPSIAFAWGPLTHVYLGSEMFSFGSLLPAGIYALIKKYRHDFLYGNLMADIIIGKKFLPENKNPHSWDMALSLLNAAETRQQRAFVLGYMSHLASDTVVHGRFPSSKKNLEHALVEMRADSIIDKRYWVQAVRIDRQVQRRNDVFLARSLDLDCVVLSFKTNKRIFKGMVLLSCFNKERLGNFIERNVISSTMLTREGIQQLHLESLNRIIDVLTYGEDAEVLRENPMVS